MDWKDTLRAYLDDHRVPMHVRNRLPTPAQLDGITTDQLEQLLHDTGVLTNEDVAAVVAEAKRAARDDD